MLPSDTYSQPNAADPVLEERTVLDIVRRHVVRCSAVTRIDETGGEARVYVLDDNLVLKVQRPHQLRPRTSLAKEAFFLQQLAAYPDIVVPHVLGYGRHDNIEYLVMTQMPGVPALTVEFTGGQRRDVLHQLGKTLRRLHSMPQAPFYDSALFPGNRTQDAFVARVRADLTHAVQVIGATPNLWQLGVSPAVTSRCGGAAFIACSRVPIRVSGWRLFSAITAGQGDHACALTLSGNIYCWGAGGLGQRGDGRSTNEWSPARTR